MLVHCVYTSCVLCHYVDKGCVYMTCVYICQHKLCYCLYISCHCVDISCHRVDMNCIIMFTHKTCHHVDTSCVTVSTGVAVGLCQVPGDG